MQIRTYRAALAAATLALLVPGTALAGDFVDTRLTFLFTDEDVLHGAAETRMSSPAARIGGGKSSTLFFDNYETKYTGFETLSNLVLYKKEESYFQNLTGEAALVVTLLNTQAKGTDQILLQDSSSYIRLNWKLPDWAQGDGLSLTAFPVSADRFRLGYSYRISWGGTPAFPRADNNAPGAKLQWTRGPFYAFAGIKTAQILNEANQERETNYGWLAGAGYDVLPTLRWEFGAGYFQRGVIPKEGLSGEPTVAAGGSTQLTWHVGQPIGTSVDFRLYKNDPDVYQRFFQPEQYPGGDSYTVSAEATYLVQTLQDYEKMASTVRQPAKAGDLQAKVDPYLRPLYDALRDMLDPDEIERLVTRQTIEVAPLAYIRGRTLSNAFVILDEAQNATTEQMFMLLTRIGMNSKCVVTGDVTQIDLPANKRSGLVEALQALKAVPGIAMSYFTERDVVRHPLVRAIINAYQQHRTPSGRK
jgi:hypothetical protein